MTKAIEEFKFHGRRHRGPLLRRTDITIGLILFGISLFGLFKSNFEMNTFFGGFLMGGFISVFSGIFGKAFFREKCYIRIGPDEIEYKNSFKKPGKLKIAELLDIRIEREKAEFVLLDHKLFTFGFSVFQTPVADKIKAELERVKTSRVR